MISRSEAYSSALPSVAAAHPLGKPETMQQGSQRADESAFFYHANHLGSTSFVTDEDGELYEHAQYFPYGEQWVLQQGNQSLPYLFTSKEPDEETGLYYFEARYLENQSLAECGSSSRRQHRYG